MASRQLSPNLLLGERESGYPTTGFRRVPRTPALDGLRGVAIAAVALFHYPTHSVFEGGLFGVGLFFVLSGFLVTPILAEEHSHLGRVRLGRFFWRRAWRLLPALLFFLVAFLVAAALFGSRPWFTSDPFGSGGPGAPLPLGLAWKGVVAAVTYTYNFFLARSLPMPAPLGHLWTLAVEGQFYVWWALLVSRLLRRGSRALLTATLVLIAVSAVSPFLAWHHGGGEAWIYFSTVPRLQQLLAGALLAQLWGTGMLDRLPSRLLGVLAALSAATMAYLVLEVGNVEFKYLGATTVVAAAGVLAIAYLVDSRTRSKAKTLLSSRPLVWLGQRSYAIYLWHWPLAEWTNLLPHTLGVPLGLGSSLVAAELSWRLVEQPAQRFARRLQGARRQPVTVTRVPRVK